MMLLAPSCCTSGFLIHEYPATRTAGVVLKCWLCLLPHWDRQGPPSPRQPLPWKPAPQRNDPFEYQCVDPLCGSASLSSTRIQAGARKIAFTRCLFSIPVPFPSSFLFLSFHFLFFIFLLTWEAPDWDTTFDPEAHCTRKGRDREKKKGIVSFFVCPHFKSIPPLFSASHLQHSRDQLLYVDSVAETELTEMYDRARIHQAAVEWRWVGGLHCLRAPH